jgi:hypothetical protein
MASPSDSRRASTLDPPRVLKQTSDTPPFREDF